MAIQSQRWYILSRLRYRLDRLESIGSGQDIKLDTVCFEGCQGHMLKTISQVLILLYKYFDCHRQFHLHKTRRLMIITIDVV